MSTPPALPPVRQRTRLAPNEVRPEGGNRMGRGDTIQFSPSSEAALKSSQSMQIVDPFDNVAIGLTGELAIVQPPFNFNALNNLPNENSMLRQCIEALVTNVEGHGWRMEYVGPEDQEDSSPALAERRMLEGFLSTTNPDTSFDETRARFRRDLETTGNAFLECARDSQGRVVMMNHIPAHSMRLTNKEPIPVAVTVEVPDGELGTYRSVKMTKNFRRYVQRSGSKTVYFKEFGDPRTINPEKGVEDNTIGFEQGATEVIHVSLYAPGSPYGLPRWINQLPSILGSRQAELTNLDFFRENAIPALAVLVSGGRLTSTALEEIENHLSAARGRQSMNRVVVMEAIGDNNAQDDRGSIPPPRLEIKPLAGERQKDGFFLEYGRDCDKKIRSSFRLPPIFVGQSEDYSHATAKASYEVAESQVFGPARRMTDDVFNNNILRSYKPRYWEVRSNPPKITDPEEVIKALEAFDRMGALTPNQVIDMANEYFDLELPRIEDEWGNFPFSIVSSLAASGRLKGLEAIQTEPQEPVADPNETDETDEANETPTPVNADITMGNTLPPNSSNDARRSAVEQMSEAFQRARFALTAAAIADYEEAQSEEEQPATVTVGA